MWKRLHQTIYPFNAKPKVDGVTIIPRHCAAGAVCFSGDVLNTLPLIVVVDDDTSLQAAIVDLVRALGYRAQGFGSAAAFMQSRELLQTRCVITDIEMPGMDGFDLIRRLSLYPPAPPVIMVTARIEPGLSAKAEATGAVALLQKPFEADALSACLARILGPT